MIELLKTSLIVVLFLVYIAILLIPAFIGAWRDNEKWLWGLLITIPFGISLIVTAMECWGLEELIEVGC